MAAPACLDIVPELQKFRLDHKKYERKLKQLMQHKRRGRAPRPETLDVRYKKAPDLGGQWQTRGWSLLARRKPSLDV